MAFKRKAVVNARLDQLSKKELIKTVKTLRGRETKLLNQVAKLEGGQADRLLDNLRPAVEFGYRAGEKGEWNLEMTFSKWSAPPPSGLDMDAVFERIAAAKTDPAAAVRKFPWETK